MSVIGYFCFFLLVFGMENQHSVQAKETVIDQQSLTEVEQLKKKLEKDPSSWKERHRLGVSYMMEGKYQEAVEEFLGVLSLTPDNVNALQSLGMAYYRMKKNNKALYYWRSALDIRPENRFIWSLIDSISDSKPLSHSSMSAQESEKNKTGRENWSEHYKSGQRYYQGKNYEKAAEEFKQAAEYNPSDSRTWFSLGVAHNAMDRMEEAVAAWRESLKIKPDDIMVMKLISMAKKKIKRELEIARAREAVEKKPGDDGNHLKLALLYLDDRHGRYLDRAEAEFKETIRLNPEQFDAYSKLAEISFYRDRYDEGIAYLEAAAEFLSEKSPVNQTVLSMKTYQKKYRKAKKVWEEKGIEHYDEMVPVKEDLMKPFSIDKYEVTNAQYERFLSTTNYAPPPHWKKETYRQGRDNYPVVNIDWYMASAYCKSMGKRLPTEQEWEMAAYGTKMSLYPWGETFEKESTNSKESGFNRLTPVGVFEKGKSPYGVYDMAGNAWEWTSTGYSKPAAEIKIPESKEFPFPQENYKIRRGGSFKTDREKLRMDSRKFVFPTHTDWDIGFRCAKSPEPAVD